MVGKTGRYERPFGTDRNINRQVEREVCSGVAISIIGVLMENIIIGIVLKYLMLSMSLSLIFGLIILDNDSKWYEYIIAILFMPFILGAAIIEIIREKKRK